MTAAYAECLRDFVTVTPGTVDPLCQWRFDLSWPSGSPALAGHAGILEAMAPRGQCEANPVSRSRPPCDDAEVHGVVTRSKQTIPLQFAVDPRRVRRLRTALLRWAATSGRHFFWREPSVTPFEVLVAEILLSKTRAELVEPIARTLLDRFDTPAKLAAALRPELERLLYPLGLHRKRAKHLVECADALLKCFEGRVPTTVTELMRLPYVGRYAANAIACVAFEQPVAVIDANVSRIYQRVFSLPDPPERLAAAHDLWALANRIVPKRQAKVFNWGVLDLGGTLCTAKAPACSRCPLRALCDERVRRSAMQPSTNSRARASLNAA